MDRLIYNKKSEESFPHGSDVLEREFAENGFAKGWAMHCKPVPKYFFDCHVHYYGDTEGSVANALRSWARQADKLDVRRALIILQVYGKKWNLSQRADNGMDKFPYFSIDGLSEKLSGLSDNKDLYWSAYLNYHSSEPELVHAVADAGAVGIKLHNAPIIEENAPHDLWLSPEWQSTFQAMGKRKLPVLWHVTQRLPASAYTEGGRNTYWQTGWANGVTYNNEDCLQVFLTCCQRNPDVNFIGAHQLHIGWERLDELFTGYPNLYVDTTVGGRLKMHDNFYPHDKEFLRSVFIRWADRILFGTDAFWGAPGGELPSWTYLEHMHFLTALDLPEAVIDKVCRGNLERLCHLESL